jgi:tetrahydromethanopterin:alpha-L-glutamate ligase
MRIALFSERRDGHAGLLIEAMARRGVEAVPVSMRDCGVDTACACGIAIPGFEDSLPDGVFVRGIPAGTFEQVTLRLSVLHALHALSIPVWNNPRAIECCIDKAMTSLLLAAAGIPTPRTFTAQSYTTALEIAERETADGKLVLKPLFGAQGRGLKLIENAGDLPEEPEIASLYYMQRFVKPAGGVWRDMRVFVCAGEVVAGMTRIGQSWITNIHQGAGAQPLLVTDDLRDLALTAARLTGADYAGVDLIRGEDGVTQVLEVNSMPAWTGLQTVADRDIAQIIADRFIAACDCMRPLKSAAQGT